MFVYWKICQKKCKGKKIEKNGEFNENAKRKKIEKGGDRMEEK